MHHQAKLEDVERKPPDHQRNEDEDKDVINADIVHSVL